MGWKLVIGAAGVIGAAMSVQVYAQRAEFASAKMERAQAAAGQKQSGASGASQSANAESETIRALVGRLDLERYKATVKGLTEFGDRRQGTDRNRKAVDWIEAQLKSYGCTNTERIKYDYQPPPPRDRNAPRPTRPTGEPPMSVGGGRPRGTRAPTGVNTDPNKQPDEKIRALDLQESTPGNAKRCTARRSGRRTRTRCTSSAGTWTGSAGAKRRMTMGQGRRW